VLLLLLLVVINGQQDSDSFRQNSSIASLFKKYLNKPVSIFHLFTLHHAFAI